MKKLLLALAVCVLALTALCLSSCGQDDAKTVRIYNWGAYIADGKDGAMDILAEFEKATGYKVIYDTYDSNENMYAVLKSGGSDYDIVIPSDYMIQQLIAEGMVQKINKANIPNYKYVDARYKGLYYDPTDAYSVPYNVGMCGIVYNTKFVRAEDADQHSVNLLWNAAYKGKILTYSNPRDGFGMAQIALGLNFNSTEKADWDLAYAHLVKQKKDVDPGYVMDQSYAEMQGNTSYVAAYYAGDCLQMIEMNEDLAFYYPKEGTNIFVDAMCILKDAKNVAGAEAFINFILEPQYAEENALYLYYASPNTAVINSESYKEALGEEGYSLLYDFPEGYLDENGKLQKAEYYHNMSNVVLTENGVAVPDGKSVLEYMTEMWNKMRRQ